ncbi:hypothetical protein HPB47_007186 [Ixodes persulcatus]|uniref:Uncharacterized protein n=1 Tax=Ixodes persulcatus TaxID=34615 RepID=A0AC60P8H6_IXOPE|nr:hypothetical protein HPB47_007186 [Ixodes persulcatus]
MRKPFVDKLGPPRSGLIWTPRVLNLDGLAAISVRPSNPCECEELFACAATGIDTSGVRPSYIKRGGSESALPSSVSLGVCCRCLRRAEMRVASWKPEGQDVPATDKKAGDLRAPVQKATKAMPRPDGALSWFMAALCFIVTLLFMCIFRTASLLYTSFMTTFQVSRGEASLPICIFGGFMNLSGLVSGPMIHSFGIRRVAIFGGLMMSIGCIVSLFATGITFLVFSLGLISGTGQGILFSCTIVCINEYFDKRRGFALGLNLAGATMASFVFPKILEFVLLEYGLKGALLLLGGMLLNIPTISLLFRPPPWIKNENKTVVEVTDASKDPYDALGKMSIVCNMNADQDKLYLEIEPSNAGRRGTVITIGDREAVRRGTAISFGERPHRIRRETDTSHAEHGSLHSRRGTIISTTETDTVSRDVAPSPADVQNQNMSRRGTLLSVAGSLTRESVLGFVDAQPTRRGTVISLGNRCQIELPTVPEEPLKIPLPSIQAARPRTAMDSARDVLLMPRFYFHTMSYFSFSFFLDGFLTIMTACYFVMAFLAQMTPFAQTKLTFWVVTISLGCAHGLSHGFFRDTYGSYDGLMRCMGGMILMSFFFTAGLWLSDPTKKKKSKLDTAGTAVANDNVSQTVKM